MITSMKMKKVSVKIQTIPGGINNKITRNKVKDSKISCESSSSDTSSGNESDCTQNGNPLDEIEAELIENEQIQTNSESSKRDHHND